jgi:hypothetical protein
MDVDALVVRDGDRVRAAGRLVRDSTGDWFQPDIAVTLPGRVEREVRPVWQPGAVRVVGAEFDAVSNRFERGGAVEGWALVTGTWSGGQLHVEQQAAPPPDGAWRPRWTTPPCPPPPGGWPTQLRRSDVQGGYGLGDLELTGAAVAVTLFRPGPDRAVLVVAAGDVAAVEARLRPQLGESLCVVPSRWTKAQLDTVGDYLHYQWELWRLYGLGLQNADDGQPHMAARLVRVLPEIAAWAAPLPKGILLLEPWLVPLRADTAGEYGLSR